MSRGLGKGLSAIFSDTKNEYENFLEVNENDVQIEIEMSLIEPSKEQPRKHFDKEKLIQLAQSIEEYGLIQPIIIVKKGKKFKLVAGERRFRAFQILERAKIPAIIKDYSDEQIKQIALIENIQRHDLNPIETAEGLKSLMTEFDLTQEQVAQKLCMSRSAVANTLRLLSLCKKVKDMVADGIISSGHARSLMTLPEAEQIKLAKLIVDREMSVREVEQYLSKAKSSDEKPQQQKLQSIEQQLETYFGTKVKLVGDEKKGKIVIEYNNEHEFKQLKDKLS